MGKNLHFKFCALWTQKKTLVNIFEVKKNITGDRGFKILQAVNPISNSGPFTSRSNGTKEKRSEQKQGRRIL